MLFCSSAGIARECEPAGNDGEGELGRHVRARIRRDVRGRFTSHVRCDDPVVRQVTFVQRGQFDRVVRVLGTDVDLARPALGTAGEAEGASLRLHFIVCDPAVRPVGPLGAHVPVGELCPDRLPLVEGHTVHLHPDEPCAGTEAELHGSARSRAEVRVRHVDLLMPLPVQPALECLPDVEVVGAGLAGLGTAAVNGWPVREVALLMEVPLRGQLFAAAAQQNAAVEVVTAPAPHEPVEVVVVERQEHRLVRSRPSGDRCLDLACVVLV